MKQILVVLEKAKPHKYLSRHYNPRAGGYTYVYDMPKHLRHGAVLAGKLDHFETWARNQTGLECGVAFKPDGTKVADQIGGARHVGFSPAEWAGMRGGVLSHNHPSGGSFSLADLELFVKHGLSEIRAVTSAGVYSLKTPAGADISRELPYIRHKFAQFEQAHLERFASSEDHDTWLAAERGHSHDLNHELASNLGLIYSFEPWIEKSQARAPVLLALLQKTQRDKIKPGHKYTSRKRKKGKWVYDYAEAAARQSDLAGKLGGLRARLAAQQATQPAKPTAPAALIVPRVEFGSMRVGRTRKEPPAPSGFTLAPDPADEPTLAGKLAKLERVICFRPVEEGHVFSLDGRRIIAKRGHVDHINGGQYVLWTKTEAARSAGCVMTHNHPLTTEGTAFTHEDIEYAVNYHLHEIRAVGQKYRHSMIIPAGSPLTGADVFLVYQKHDQAIHAEMLGKIRSGAIDVAAANLHHRHELWLRAAPELGLTYAREEWSE